MFHASVVLKQHPLRPTAKPSCNSAWTRRFPEDTSAWGKTHGQSMIIAERNTPLLLQTNNYPLIRKHWKTTTFTIIFMRPFLTKTCDEELSTTNVNRDDTARRRRTNKNGIWFFLETRSHCMSMYAVFLSSLMGSSRANERRARHNGGQEAFFLKTDFVFYNGIVVL